MTFAFVGPQDIAIFATGKYCLKLKQCKTHAFDPISKIHKSLPQFVVVVNTIKMVETKYLFPNDNFIMEVKRDILTFSRNYYEQHLIPRTTWMMFLIFFTSPGIINKK